MPSDNEIQWLNINDFSPGIVSRKGVFGNSGTVIAPPGAATVTNTYRCIALPGGGLGPLPKRVRDLSVTDADVSAQYNVTGMCLFGPVFHPAGAGFSYSFPPLTTTPFEMHLAWEQVQGGGQSLIWRRYRYYSDSGFDTIKLLVLAAVTNKFGPCYFAIGRALSGGGTAPGIPIVVGDWRAVEDNPQTAGHTLPAAFPSPAAPGVIGTYDYTALPGIVIAHQARMVFLLRSAVIHGTNADGVPLNESVLFTDLNSTVISASTQVFGQEYPVGYGAWGSLTSSDLLLIKHYGGAYLIQGDIASPIVRRLPNVVSTAGSECVGAHSAIGFVYGVNNGGVYAWGGGDSSISLSPQLEDGFWQSTAVKTYLYGGTFMGWGSWILTPNNYLYDIDLKSWWRIDDVSASRYFIWQRDPFSNIAYGALPVFSSVDKRYASGYDRTVPAVNYSWQSHYFFASQGRTVAVREFLLLAMGPGTVSVTVRSDTGQTNTTVVTLTSGLQYYRRPIAVEGTRHQVQLVADNGSSAAPIIGELQLGWYPAHRLPNT